MKHFSVPYFVNQKRIDMLNVKGLLLFIFVQIAVIPLKIYDTMRRWYYRGDSRLLLTLLLLGLLYVIIQVYG